MSEAPNYIARLLDELEAENRELEADAERYRKLRKCIGNKDASLKAQALFWNVSSRKKFDAAVDGLESKS